MDKSVGIQGKLLIFFSCSVQHVGLVARNWPGPNGGKVSLLPACNRLLPMSSWFLETGTRIQCVCGVCVGGCPLSY